MLCKNIGGTLAFGNANGDTVFMRKGNVGDVPDPVFARHADKLRRVSEGGPEAANGRPPRVRTAQTDRSQSVRRSKPATE